MDLLRTILAERGRWTEAVAYEASRSATHLPDLAQIVADGWLGVPIEVVDEGEIQQIERIRRAVFGGTEERPLRHLGEVQTCFLVLERSELVDLGGSPTTATL